MDPVSHTLTGFVLSKTITKHKALIITFLIFSLLPDIDLLLRIHSTELFLNYHRGITHGVMASFLLPLIPAFILRVKTGFFKTYFLAFLAYGMHIFLDFTNQYGIKILSPFDWGSYDLSLTFIIDPYVVLPLLLAVILSIKFKKQAKLFYVLSLIFITIYIGVKAYLKVEARDFLKQKIEAHQYRVYPMPNDFLRWWFVARFSDEYITGCVDLFGKRIYIDSRYKIKNDDLILKSKESESVKSLLNFAKHPAAEIKKEGDTIIVVWRELSYGFLPNDRFTAKVWIKETSQGYKITNTKLKI
ncbi:MAG: metal-dependent hydrolase [Thermodesulfovibrio sp.]|nr:metal-dependent hydrolase [Thermodesulfovibrio sp.]